MSLGCSVPSCWIPLPCVFPGFRGDWPGVSSTAGRGPRGPAPALACSAAVEPPPACRCRGSPRELQGHRAAGQAVPQRVCTMDVGSGHSLEVHR